MTRFVCLATVAVCAVLMATGCAGSTSKASERSTQKQDSVHGATPTLPLVIARPTVQLKDLPNAKVRHLGAGGRLISSTLLAFMTTGSSNCLWLPTRLTVLSPTVIRIDMRVHEQRVCLADLIGRPVAVKINPRIVNVHRPLTVRLAYKATYCCGKPSKIWHRKFIAAATPRL
jgi:hypothetical protein